MYHFLEVNIVQFIIRTVGKTAVIGFTLECITFTYPFDFELASGAVSTVNSDEEVEALFLNLNNYVIDFVYPVEALNQERELVTISNVVQLADVFVKCIPTTGLNITSVEMVGFPAFYFEDLCIELSFPLRLRKSNPDSTIVVIDKQSLADALARQYQYYAYPLNVFDFESGDTISLTDDMALMETLFDCEEKVSANLTFNSLMKISIIFYSCRVRWPILCTPLHYLLLLVAHLLR